MSARRTAWCALGASAAILAAGGCGPGSVGAVSPFVVPTLTPAPAATPTLAPSAACAAPLVTSPGAYTTFVALAVASPPGANPGTVGSVAAFWSRDDYVAATPVPSATPTAAPSPAASPMTINVFSGTYHLAFASGANPSDGCAVILAQQSGSQLYGGQTYNASITGSLSTALAKGTNVATGRATISVTTLPGGTGSGTISLDDGETGTIAITSLTTTIR